MTLPTIKVMVDWDNDGTFTAGGIEEITADALRFEYNRGANFDGSAESPGSCTLTLRNDDGRYTPDYASGSRYGNLVIGRKVWITATYSAVSYGVFYGVIRRLTPLADKTVEIYAEDPLGTVLGKRTGVVELSQTRSIRDFRDALLDNCSVAAGQRSLAYGIENNVPVTYLSKTSVLGALDDLNAGTGTLHYVKPHPTAGTHWQYVTIDRTAMQNTASSETWDDEKIVGMSGWDLTDEAIVNEQSAAAIKYVEQPADTVWEWTGMVTVPSAGSVTVWAVFPAPVFAITGGTTTHDVQGTFTRFTVNYGEVAAILLSVSGAGGGPVTGLTITGVTAETETSVAAVASDTTSQTTYGGVYSGSPIESRYITGDAEAAGLAEWYVERYSTPKARPTLTKQDHFPSMLAREIGDVITLNFARLSISAQRFFIRSLSGSVDASEGTWYVTYGLERALDTGTYLTLDTENKGLDDEGPLGEGMLAI